LSQSQNTRKTLLILDLDETLIHATTKKLSTDPDFIYADYYIYRRPYLDLFLIDMSLHFQLAIWSSADDQYVNDIVKSIQLQGLTFEFIWGRSRCTPRRDYDLDRYVHEKRLKKVKKQGFTLGRTLIVDDSPEKTKDNFGNAIYIKPFTGNSDDSELLDLAIYLKTIKDVEHVRRIEKRGWKDKIR